MTRLPDHPVVNPVFTVDVRGPDEVVFRAGPFREPVTLETEDGDGGPAALVDALDGETTTAAAVAAAETTGFDAEAALERLVRAAVVVDDDDAARYRRYLADGLVGGDGSVLLVESGETADTLGAILDESEGVSTEYVDPPGRDGPGGVDLAERVAAVDHVVSVTDRPRPDLETELNEAALTAETPWTRARIDGGDAVVGPTVVPGATACLSCLRTRRDANVPDGRGYAAHLDRRRETTPPSVPSPVCHLVAGLVGCDLHRQFDGDTGVTVGRVIHYDLRRLSVAANDVLRLPRCESCGDDATTVDDPRHVTLESMLREVTDGDP